MSGHRSLDRDVLAQFTGTSNWFRHALVRDVLYTDGARYVADHAGAYWLLDEIALAQVYDSRVAAEPFQLWVLKVTGNVGELTCEDGDGNLILTKLIPYTDFPAQGIRLYCCDRTIMLPCEY
jgi:hypothetical protein